MNRDDEPEQITWRQWIFTFRDVMIALLVLLLLDGLIFKSGAYFQIMEPISFAGQRQIWTLRHRTARELFPDTRWVVFLGNSTFGQGIREDMVDKALDEAESPWRALNLSQGGASPRLWFHTAINTAILGPKTAALVLGVPHSIWYDKDRFFTTWSVDKNVHTDLKALAPLYGFRDLPRLMASIEDREKALQAAAGVAFRSLALRQDLRRLVLNPGQRLRSLADHPEILGPSTQLKPRPAGQPLSLTGARLNEDRRLVSEAMDPRYSKRPEILDQVEAHLRLMEDMGPQEGALSPQFHPVLRRYMMDLARLADDRGIPVVFAVVPSNPFPVFASQDFGALEGMVDELRKEGRDVRLFLHRPLLNRLQKPKFFGDLLHLNQEGASVYSFRLGQWLADTLPAPPREPPPAEKAKETGETGESAT